MTNPSKSVFPLSAPPSDARRVFVAALVGGLAGLTACANRGPKEVLPRLIVKKIAILPVLEPSTVSLENRNSVAFFVPIAGAAVSVDSLSKQKIFSQKVLDLRLPLGADLTAYLLQAFDKEGFQVVMLAGVPRPADDPEGIDYDKISTDADAILHVYIDNIGLFSGYNSTDYLPRVNVVARLHSTKRDEDLYDGTLYYGVDARVGKPGAIMADPRFAYPSFDNLMLRLPEVATLFATATQALAQRMVADINKALK